MGYLEQLLRLGRSVETVRVYGAALRRLGRALDARRPTPASIVAALPPGVSAATRALYLTAARGLLAHRGGRAAELGRALPSVTLDQGAPRPLAAKQLLALDAAARQVGLGARRWTPASRRDSRVALLYLLLRVMGLRTSDALALNSSDVVLERGQERLCLHPGKGRRERTLPIVGGNADADRLLRLLGQVLRGRLHDQAVFESRLGRRWTARQARRAWSEVARDAGLPDVTLHRLRHTRATELAASGLTAHELQHFFGWRSLEVAARYVAPGDLRAALRRVQR